MDLKFEDHGSVVIVYPLSPAGRQWVQEHVETEGWQWMGEYGFACEPRAAQDVASGARECGLAVQARL